MSIQGQRLRGRTGECETLRGLLSAAKSGSSQVLVVRGEPGVGKSELLRYTADQASGFRRTRIGGVQSDMELAFAGLQQLCAPLLENLDELPEPQREALNVAFGRGVGAAPDRFLVGLAVLSLIAAATDDQPLLCVVDDAQWLDEVSVQVLAFVARRLLAEPVAVVFAARDGGAPALAGLPELAISGLSDDDARELLQSVMPGGIDPRVRDRIVAEARGIPLALLEVPRNVPATELAGGFWDMGARRSVGQIEESYLHRIRSLPADSRQLLLLAAAEPVGDAALFMRAASQLGLPVDALAPAEAAGVVKFGPHMRFRHPLMRSAAYRAADLTDRRTVHRALAAATNPHTDPDRRAWHAANATAGPDDAVAAELEASAGRAQSRGGIAAAATFLERATALTSDPALRVSRALTAAQVKRDAADPTAAHELLSIAELGPMSDLQRAQAARLRAQMAFARSRRGEAGAPPLAEPAGQLLAAAQQLENLEDAMSRDTYLEAFVAAMYAGRLGDPGALERIAEAARVAVARVPHLARPSDLLLSGFANLVTTGAATAVGPLRAALGQILSQAQPPDGHVLRWAALGLAIVQENAAGEVWDDAIWNQLASNMVRQARAAGALAVLPPALAFRAGTHLWAGEFATAANLLEEATSIAAATDHLAPMRYHSLSLVAFRGNPADALPIIEAVAAGATARGEGRALAMAAWATAVVYNGAGRYEEAFAAARDACGFDDLGLHGWCLSELVEAAARSGDLGAARAAADRLEARAGASGADFGLGVLASARAMTVGDEQAEALFAESVERLERTSMVIHLARAHLRYGEWLRRLNRRADARKRLSRAHEMYSRMGAQAFAERARRELIATGEKVRKQPISSGDELTAQEGQIARLAADGLTNQEIGAQLFISTHTVEWHLRKVFVKLGITSRRQLRTVAWVS